MHGNEGHALAAHIANSGAHEPLRLTAKLPNAYRATRIYARQ